MSTTTSNLTKTNLYNTLADSILGAAAEQLGYSRTDLDRVVEALALGDELHQIILDAICCAAVSPWTLAAGYTANTAERIASAVSSREFESGLKIDMRKGE